MSATPALLVQTGARLHCGLFSDHRLHGRRFQGVGLMLDHPGYRLRVTPHAGSQHELTGAPGLTSVLQAAISELQPAFHKILQRLAEDASEFQTELPSSPPLRFELHSIIERHVGLGSGTQFALAVGHGWNQFQAEARSTSELSTLLGRGQRSCIGTFGFERGGLLIDRGVQQDETRGACRFWSPLPEDWRFILATPRGIRGLAGEHEVTAFRKLPALSDAHLDQLLGLLDAWEQPSCLTDFDHFSDVLREFGLLVGAAFAPVQSGRFVHPACETIFDRCEQLGLRGVAQSSWGPTMFAVCRHTQEAEAAVEELSRLPDIHLQIARPGGPAHIRWEATTPCEQYATAIDSPGVDSTPVESPSASSAAAFQ